MTARSLLASLAASSTLALALATGVLAHGGGEETGLSVEPNSLAAGGTVVLVGTGLEPNSERTLVLAGPGMSVDLGTVMTDADGMFQIQLTIPSHLPAGTYELRAIGDEVLTIPLALTAADGASGADTTAGQETVIPHERHALELALLGVAVLALLGVGLVLIRFAERFGRPPMAREPASTAED